MMENKELTIKEENNREFLPIIILKDVVVFPYMVTPLFVGRPKSVKAVEKAMEENRSVLLVLQTDVSLEDPTPDQLHRYGCRGNILQILKLPDGTIKILIEGKSRIKLDKLVEEDG